MSWDKDGSTGNLEEKDSKVGLEVVQVQGMKQYRWGLQKGENWICDNILCIFIGLGSRTFPHL